MSLPILANVEPLLLEDVVWVLPKPPDRHRPFEQDHYDFLFERFFACRRPWQRPPQVPAVARLGAFSSQYQQVADALHAQGIALIHTPEEHLRCSSLPVWYPRLKDLTPRSLWFSGAPDVAQIEAELGWPIFMKGDRQTKRHRRDLAIIQDREHFQRAVEFYAEDPALQWQTIICRQYLPLRLVSEWDAERLPASWEFRTFWWRGALAGRGCYWWNVPEYQDEPRAMAAGVSLAREAARRIDVTFLAVDIAQTVSGEWVVIEVNDAQECGYTGVPPTRLWSEILSLERQRPPGPAE